jgi:hypothetical protein
MGQLMALALLCTMMAAVLFQPALMGPPREVARDEPAPAPREPELIPAMATWTVERVGPAATNPPARPARVSRQHENQDLTHEIET